MRVSTIEELEKFETETLRGWVLSNFIVHETKANALRIIERRTFEDAYEQGRKGELETES